MKTILTYQCRCGEYFYENDTACLNCQRPIDRNKLREIEVAETILSIKEKSQEHSKSSDLLAENKKLKEALLEISKGEGAYDMDRLKHASNTIETMKQIAITALGGKDKKGSEDVKTEKGE